MYLVCERTSIEDDLAFLVEDLRENNTKAKCVIVYCCSLNMCSSLYAHFLYKLKEKAITPLVPTRLVTIGFLECSILIHNKEVILKSMVDVDGTIRVVFATMTLGMRVNFVGLNTTIHYSAPHSIDDYFQESGRAGRSGVKPTSTIY